MNETRKIEKRKMMGPITILMAMTAVMMIVAAIIMASCTTVDSTVGYTTGQNNETAEKTAEDVSVTTSGKSVWMAATTAVRINHRHILAESGRQQRRVVSAILRTCLPHNIRYRQSARFPKSDNELQTGTHQKEHHTHRLRYKK